MRKGYVTVFFSISVSLCLSLLVGLVYGARDSASRMRAREVFDITMTSAFSEYDRQLWEQYGLLFIDSGYSNEAMSMILPEEHARMCMEKNFDEKGSFLFPSKDLLDLHCSFVETEAVRFACDYGGQPIFNQAVRYMKYHYKIEYVEQLFKAAKEYEEYELSESDLKETQDEALEALKDKENILLAELKKSASEAVTDKKDIGFLDSLKFSLWNAKKISNVSVEKETLLSKRKKNVGNAACEDSENKATEILLFKEYLLEKCGNYINEKDGSAMKYEAEYLISGKMTDANNFEGVANRILLMREAANLAALYADSSKQEIVLAFSAVISALLFTPELTEPIRALINSVWAYLESVSDLRRLLTGKKVPLLKNETTWTSGLEIIGAADNKNTSEEGLSYQDYLRIILYLEKADKLLERFMDICELDVRKASGNKRFRLDYCFDYWEITAYVWSGYGYSYRIRDYKDMEVY